MRRSPILFLLILLASFWSAQAQVYKLDAMTTPEIAALDRAHTVVLLTGAILEEHGPYLPVGIDGYWHEAITQEVARTIIARPGWKAVLVPPIPLGAAAANVIPGKYSFPGSFTVRADTVRDVYMDLADSFGGLGFKYIFVIDGHGGPPNNVALDTASDYFHDTYSGTMVHLMGLMQVFEAYKTAEQMLTPAQLATNGLSVHADAFEQSEALFVRPDLVPAAYKDAPALGASDFPGLVAQAAKPDWPGYLGAPALGSAAIGAQLFHQTIATLRTLTDGILDGKLDASKLPRYGATFMELTKELEAPLIRHEAEQAAQHDRWLKAHHLEHVH